MLKNNRYVTIIVNIKNSHTLFMSSNNQLEYTGCHLSPIEVFRNTQSWHYSISISVLFKIEKKGEIDISGIIFILAYP